MILTIQPHWEGQYSMIPERDSKNGSKSTVKPPHFANLTWSSSSKFQWGGDSCNQAWKRHSLLFHWICKKLIQSVLYTFRTSFVGPLIPSNSIEYEWIDGVSMGCPWDPQLRTRKNHRSIDIALRPATSPQGAKSKPGVDASNVLMCGVFVPSEALI